MSKLALADTSAMYGIVEPRIITPPLRPLTPETSAGFRLCEWAATYISQPLAPHQKLFFQHALEIHPEDPSRYRHRTVLMIGGRQGSFKTSTATIYQLWRLTEDGGQLALITSAQRDNAREAFLRAVKLIQDNPEVLKLVKSIRRANGQEAIDFKNGSRIKILGKPENARGNSADVAWMDELLTHEDYDMFAAIRPTITARPKGQLLATSNAGTVKSIVLNTLRSEAIAGGPGAPFIAEWSSPTGAELSDWDGLRQALPGLGYVVPEDDIISALKEMPANKFRAEYRCELVESLDSIVSPEQWANCKDDGDLSSHRSNIVACLDVSSDLMHSTLCVAAQLPDGRIRIEVAGAWDSTSDMRAQLQDLLARIKPVKFGWFSGSPSSAVAVELRGIRGAKEIPPKATVEACLGLVEQVNASRILHNGDPLLATHILSAKKLPSVDGWRFQRKDAGQVDAAYACAGAILLARSLKPRQPFVFLTAPAEVSGGGTHG